MKMISERSKRRFLSLVFILKLVNTRGKFFELASSSMSYVLGMGAGGGRGVCMAKKRKEN